MAETSQAPPNSGWPSPDDPILSTKLYMPRMRTELVSRDHLVERLNTGLWATGPGDCPIFARRLTLISAAAGFGKTTLAVEWLHTVQSPHNAGQPNICWLSLDEDDNDPARFLNYLVTAVGTLQPGLGAEAHALLQTPQQPSPKAVLTRLINDLVARPAHLHTIVALDDYHVIEQPIIHATISYLLDHLPPQTHLVIISRIDPPLPLARLRGRGLMIELRAADLRFTSQEIETFFKQVMRVPLPDQAIAVLEARTEGWISGLQLAGLSMQGRSGARLADFITTFGGSHRHIIDYLAEEVMAQQTGDMQTFLCQTGILSQLTGSLCDAVTGRNDSTAMLKQLEQANLFLVPLDDERHWYRYHRLFADFLGNRLLQESPEQVAGLHRRAAHWYERQGWPAEAVQHALSGGDFAHAAHLVEQVSTPLLMHGQTTTLRAWLKALPEDLVRSRPRLCVLYALALLIAGQLDGVETYLGYAEQHIPPGSLDLAVATPTQRTLLGQIATAHAFLAIHHGDIPQAAELAQRATRSLPEDDKFSRSIAAWLTGLAYYFDRDPAMVIQAMSAGIERGQAVDSPLITMLSVYMTAYLRMLQGHLRQSREIFQNGLQMAYAEEALNDEYWHQHPSPSISLIYQGLGELLRECNELEESAQYLAKCIEIGEEWGNAEVLADSYIALARLKQAQGDSAGANAAIQKAERLGREHKISVLTARQVYLHQARLWIAQGDLEAAARWAATCQSEPITEDGDKDSLINLYLNHLKGVTLVRLWLAQGRFGQALERAQTLLSVTQATGWTGAIIEQLALQALTLHGLGQSDQALTVLGQALSLAEPEGYVRLLIDEGSAMATLLQKALAQGIVPDYAGKLLAALNPATDRRLWPSKSAQAPAHNPSPEQSETAKPRQASGQPAPATAGLFEPLSQRELEIVQLVADGLSNHEIAQRLIISVGTVKRHVSNIFAKLDAHSRIQAVAKARDLRLI